MLEPPDLLGRWRLSRTMTEHRTADSGTAVGRLDVATGPAGLTWVETVQLRWAGRVLPATRTYVLTEDDDGWAVRFADGGLFHRWRVDEEVEHLCGRDVYRGLVRVDGADVLVRWRVTGPAKDLTLATVLRR